MKEQIQVMRDEWRVASKIFSLLPSSVGESQ
jgi:hypothetical protein